MSVKGFWIEPDSWKTDKLVAEGDEAYERTIVAEAAGSIYGQVLDEEGEFTRGALMRVLLVKRPEKYENHDNFHWIESRLNEGFEDHQVSGKFYTPTLPLGGTYAILARDGHTWIVSKPIELTDENPIQEITY